jgi:hypothetical protein
MAGLSRAKPEMTCTRIFCLYYNQCKLDKRTDKAVILSEALRRSIAHRELYGAESKDPGDACWQMLLGAFRPQTTTEDKNPKHWATFNYPPQSLDLNTPQESEKVLEIEGLIIP